MAVVEKQNAEMLQQVEQLHLLLTNSLPTNIDAKNLSVVSTAPFKALTVREALFHRTEELTGSILMLLKADNVIAASFLARGIMENTALQYKLFRTIKNRANIKAADLDAMLKRMMLGFRKDEDFPEVYHITTLLGDLNKLIEGFMGVYDILSEYVHPNSSGVARVYTVSGSDKYELNFAKNKERLQASLHSVLCALTGCLPLYLQQYDQMAEVLKEWVYELRAEDEREERILRVTSD